MNQIFVFLLLIICLAGSAAGCVPKPTRYVWKQLSGGAQFPESYGYPVFVLEDQTLFALNNGGWVSKDAVNWTKTALPESGLNAGYQKYIRFGDAVYWLGAISGNYLDFTVSTGVRRTRDGQKWETVAESSELPHRIFYGAVVFQDKLWLFGGYDGKRYYNDVWTSADGVRWTRVAEKTEWSARTAQVIVFKDRLWLIGGGVIDGEVNPNPNSGNEIWSSADGVKWTKADVRGIDKLGGTPIVFDERLWLVGANRNDGVFGNAVLTSDDGANWRALSAPWSPRGAPVLWVFADRLFMTGGKFSYRQPNGELKFVYSNDVWTMSKVIKN